MLAGTSIETRRTTCETWQFHGTDRKNLVSIHDEGKNTWSCNNDPLLLIDIITVGLLLSRPNPSTFIGVRKQHCTLVDLTVTGILLTAMRDFRVLKCGRVTVASNCNGDSSMVSHPRSVQLTEMRKGRSYHAEPLERSEHDGDKHPVS